jgi:hypothetical protein
MWFSRSRKHIILVDVGSTSVAIALLDLSTGKPQIALSERTMSGVSADTPYQARHDAAVKTARAAAHAFAPKVHAYLKRQKVGRPAQGVITFSSPWYLSKTSVVSIEKPAPFMFDKRSLGDIIEKEEREFERAAAEAAKSRFPGHDVHMIERAVMRAKLNGYETPDPFFKRARSAEFCIYMSAVPHPLLLAVDEVFRHECGLKHVTAHTFPFASFAGVKELFPHERGVFLVDAGGEATDVTLVRDGAIEMSESFPYGRNHVLRAIAASTGGTVESASSALNLLATGMLSDEEAARVKSAATAAADTWAERWQSARKVVEAGKEAVPRVFLTAKSDFAPFAMEALDRAGLQAFRAEDTVLSGRISYAPQSYRDPSLSLEAIMVTDMSKRTVENGISAV